MVYLLVLDLHCITSNYCHQFERKIDPIVFNTDLLGAHLETEDIKR